MDDYIEYRTYHDLKWLKDVCASTLEGRNPKDRWDQGYASAMDLVFKLIDKGMTKPEESE